MAEHMTVADLLPEGLQLAPAMAQAEADEQRGAAEGERPAASLIPWDLVARPAEDALRGLLERDPIELLAQGWLKAKAFRDYADPAKYPPEETIVVHLADHKFSRDLHPVISVSMAGCPPVKARFTLVLAAQFSGVALSIRAGHIVSGRLGDASVSGRLKYGSIPIGSEQQSKKLKLPGEFSFKAPGLRIPPRPAQPSVNASL